MDPTSSRSTLSQRGMRCFENLRNSDLDEVYAQAKQDALRDLAFHARLDGADTIEKLRELVFDDGGADRWSVRELLEISNRFRLLGSPEDEIRLFEESNDPEFRTVPRAREFYLLALNKSGRAPDCVRECLRYIREGGGKNGLVWGILGDAYSLQILSIDKAAATAEGGSDCCDAAPGTCILRHVPEFDAAGGSLRELLRLRRELLYSAIDAYRCGFESTGTAFPGLEWMIRTMDKKVEITTRLFSPDPPDGLHDELERLERKLARQPVLVHFALEVAGGRESLNFWTHAGEIVLAFQQGHEIEQMKDLLAHAFATLDAGYKLDFLLNDLSRIREQHARIMELSPRDPDEADSIAERMKAVMLELESARTRFNAGGGRRGSALDEEYRKIAEAEPEKSASRFLARTINFRALTDTLLPQYVPGGIGRVGARVPDLTINRQVQEDLRALVNEKILPSVPPDERTDPKNIINAIRRLTGEWLKLADLQDLQSESHRCFDATSDALILLSGIDPPMRIGSRSTTDLTASMLLRTGDCRETMYLNGALFATYQRMQFQEKLREAVKCLQKGETDEALCMAQVDIPGILRYQLRGGHVAVYVEGISVTRKYHAERVSEDDPTAVERKYDLECYMAGQPLTRYELDNSKLLATYSDGTMTVLEPRDPLSGLWRPIEHMPVDGGGIPAIPDTGSKGGAIVGIRLLNLVEEHSMTFLYDGDTGKVELCDGFYNESLFPSPYCFGSGVLDLEEAKKLRGLIAAGTRAALGSGGEIRHCPVFIEFLSHSRTDYAPSLGEGDCPDVYQLMGRIFEGNLQEERKRLERGTSALPEVLEKVHSWGLRQLRVARRAEVADQRFVRVLIELARDRPELVTLKDVTHDAPLITQGRECRNVFLVLSGEFRTFVDGEVVVQDGKPLIAPPGTVLGEISALHGCLPTATVSGSGTVLRIAKEEFLRQLEINPVFRESVEELVATRLERDRRRNETRGMKEFAKPNDDREASRE